MKIDGKDRWIFKLEKDFTSKIPFITSKLAGTKLINNKLGYLTNTGLIVIKEGFSWDGCTPKWAWFDIVFGTPDGVIDKQTGKPKTYYASLMHDFLYQFAPREYVTRKYADKVMLAEMAKTGYKPRYVYYFFIRLFGWYWWIKRKPK